MSQGPDELYCACGAELTAEDRFCGSCGQPVPDRDARTDSRRFPRIWALISTLAVAGVVAVIVWVGLGNDADPDSPPEVADQSRPPVAAGERVEATTTTILALTQERDSAMFRAGPARTGAYPGPAVEGPPTERWRFPAGENLASSPAVVDGVVYVGSSEGDVYAVDTSTGEQRWRFSAESTVESSPAVVDGVVFVGSNDGNLYAVDEVSGEEVWRFPTRTSLVASSPAVVGGVVYVGGGVSLYAVEASSGEQLWRFPTGGQVGFSSPAVVGEIVYIGSADGNLYALEVATGEEVWRFATEGEVYSSPAVVNGVIYFGSIDGSVYAVDGTSGDQLWRFPTDDQVFSSPSIVDGVVYAGSLDGHMYAVDAASGEELWRFAIGDRVASSPAVADGVLYFGSGDGSLYAVDVASGEERWRFRTGEFVFSSPAVVDGVVYFGSFDGNLYAVESGDGSEAESPVLSVEELVWSRVPHDDSAFGGPGRHRMESVTVGGPGFVAVGFAWPDIDEGFGSAAAVWTSPDGLSWSRVPHDEGIFGGQGDQQMKSVTVGGPGLVAVGLDCLYFDECTAAVWTSPDGLSWSRVPHDEAIFGGFAPGMESVTAGGPGLVAVGSEWDGPPLAWTSPDGVTWSEIRLSGGRSMSSVTSWGSELVAVGEECDFDYVCWAAVWTSPDGLTWSRVPHDEATFESDTLMWAVTAGGPGLVAVGGEVNRDPDAVAVWTSPDGLSWSRVPHGDAPSSGRMLAVIPVGQGLVAVGEEWTGDGSVAAVWTSSDGIAWSRVPHDEAVFGNAVMTEVVIRDSILVAVGSDRSGNAAVWVARPEG